VQHHRSIVGSVKIGTVKIATVKIGTVKIGTVKIGRDMNLVSHIHLVPRLRMSGAIPVLPLCAFNAWTGKILPLYIEFLS
jgi:hypothetical protein